MSGFHRVGKTSQFRDGRGNTGLVGDAAVAVFRRGDSYYAFTDKCPHMGASLAMGRLVGDRVRCAWHEWTFDLATGESDMREWACIDIHEVRINGDDVLVKLHKKPPEAEHADREADPGDEWFVWDPE